MLSTGVALHVRIHYTRGSPPFRSPTLAITSRGLRYAETLIMPTCRYGACMIDAPRDW